MYSARSAYPYAYPRSAGVLPPSPYRHRSAAALRSGLYDDDYYCGLYDDDYYLTGGLPLAASEARALRSAELAARSVDLDAGRRALAMERAYWGRSVCEADLWDYPAVGTLRREVAAARAARSGGIAGIAAAEAAQLDYRADVVAREAAASAARRADVSAAKAAVAAACKADVAAADIAAAEAAAGVACKSDIAAAEAAAFAAARSADAAALDYRTGLVGREAALLGLSPYALRGDPGLRAAALASGIYDPLRLCDLPAHSPQYEAMYPISARSWRGGYYY